MKNTLFNLIICDHSKTPSYNWVASYLYDSQKIADPEVAIRTAVKDFLASENGKRICDEYAGTVFNWGHVVTFISEEYLESYGLTQVRCNTFNASVDFNENLI